MKRRVLLSGLAAVGVAFAITAACERGTPADPMVEEPAAASIVPVTSSTAEEITEPTVLYACYNPSGSVYRIKEPGLPDECLAPSHVEFSWNVEGEQGPKGDQGDPGEPGLHCWDLNGNGVADLPDEDANSDEVVDVLDCKGDKGDPGDPAPPGAELPSGVIVMWAGSEVPDGWALCDGGNGTPDLSGRFVRSYSSGALAIGDKGGSSTHGHVLQAASMGGYPTGVKGVFDSEDDQRQLTNSKEHLPPYYVLAFIMKL